MGTISETETILTINALENSLADLGYSIERGAATEAARREFHP
jgi:aspartate aminotransferase-like enzyme